MLSKSGFLVLRVIWRAGLLSLLAGGLFLFVTYFTFWQLEQQRERLIFWLSTILEQPVTLQTLIPTWEGGNPQLHLKHLQIGKHHLQHAIIELDLFASILSQKPILKYIRLNGLNVSIETTANAPPLLDKEIIYLAQQIDPFISQIHLYLENAEFSNAHFKINIKRAEWLKNGDNYLLTGQLERVFSDLYFPTITQGYLNFEATLNPYKLEATLRLFLEKANIKFANQIFEIPHLKSQLKAQWQEHLKVTGYINIPTVDLAIVSVVNFPFQATGILNNIEINIDNRSFIAQIQGKNLSFFFQNYYDDPIKVSQLNAKICWGEHPQFELTLSNEDIEHLQFKGTVNDWSAKLKNADISKVYYYMPNSAVAAKQWLMQGLTEGKITQAQAQWKHHRLVATAQVEKVSIDYSIGWQPITHLKAEVTIRNDTLTIQAQEGMIANSQILPTTQAVIEHFTSDHPVLTVDGQLRGDAADGLQFIYDSPLEDLDLQGLSLTGAMELDLKLVIPLAKEEKIITEGIITLKNNELSNELLAEKELSLTHLNGTIYFDNERLNAEKIKAKLLDYPISLQIEQTIENGLQVDLTGKADRVFLERLFQRLNPQLVPFSWHLSGQTTWHAQLNSSPEELPVLEITTDLEGAAITLPAPLGKQAEEKRLLKYRLPLEEGEGRFQYANLFNGVFSTDFRRGTLQWGEQLAKLTHYNGWKIIGNFPEIELENWLFLFDNLPNSSIDVSFLFFDVSTLALKFANQSWDNFKIKGSVQNLILISDKINGNISYNKGLLKIDLKNLTLQIPNHEDQPPPVADLEPRDTVYQTIRLDPRQLPSIQFKCLDLKLNDLKLGDWRFQTTPTEDGLSIDRLQAQTEYIEMIASGNWQVSPHWTSLHIELTSDDFGKALKQLGYESGTISGGKVTAVFQGNYPGDPLQFDRGYLEGSLSLKISNGRLEDIEPGAGRIFGLFDLYSAPKRLFLDFGDVLGKGLKFDNIIGEFSLVNGFAQTKATLLESSMSNVIFQGKTDLRRRLYDQMMIVMPKVADTLSVASLSLGGIGVKAATLLLQSLLKDELNQFVKFKYHITGSWEQPRIKMVE